LNASLQNPADLKQLRRHRLAHLKGGTALGLSAPQTDVLNHSAVEGHGDLLAGRRRPAVSTRLGVGLDLIESFNFSLNFSDGML
jgi:hypothetical protein